MTNGEIDEAVARAIGDMNETLKERGLPPIETKVRGELVREAKSLQSDLWPSELVDAKDLLELYLHDGRDVFPKGMLAGLLESTLPFGKTDKGKPQPKTVCSRAIASAAVLTSLVLSSFTENENHVAEVEAWVLYVAYALALAERWDLGPKYYESEIEIALRAIKNSLTNLAEEVLERKHLMEGLVTVDKPFYRVRVTWVAALLCVLGLWRRADGDEENELDSFIRRFPVENNRHLTLWGEAAILQFLAVYWHDRLINATSMRADGLLKSLAQAVCKAKQTGGAQMLPDVYVEAKDWLPYMVDQELEEVLPNKAFRLVKEPLTTSFQGYSHVLEGLIHLLVQQNWKQEMRALWPAVTRINLHTFEFNEPWHFYRWRNDAGTEKAVIPQHTQRWEDLRIATSNTAGDGLPTLIRQYPIFALLFICVYPHRTNADILRWLNIALKEAVYATRPWKEHTRIS